MSKVSFVDSTTLECSLPSNLKLPRAPPANDPEGTPKDRSVGSAEYMVDLVLGGDMGAGKPVPFLGYAGKLGSITPAVGPMCGGVTVKLLTPPNQPPFLFDGGSVRARCVSKDQEISLEVTYDAEEDCLTFQLPPLWEMHPPPEPEPEPEVAAEGEGEGDDEGEGGAEAENGEAKDGAEEEEGKDGDGDGKDADEEDATGGAGAGAGAGAEEGDGEPEVDAEEAAAAAAAAEEAQKRAYATQVKQFGPERRATHPRCSHTSALVLQFTIDVTLNGEHYLKPAFKFEYFGE